MRLLLKAFGIKAKAETEGGLDQEKYIRSLPAPNVLIIFLGLAFVTAYAEIWSLFMGVGTLADYALIVFSLIVMFFNSKSIGKIMTTDSKLRTGIYLVLILLFAYATSRGYLHIDTNLYHAQAIRWIEEFGVVPGLANLQSRLGYNSSEFALNALYSWKWYLGQSLHTTAGFFALLSSFLLVDVKHIWEKRDENNKIILNIRLSDYVRLGLLFYLGIIFSELISPASDYYAQLMIFDILIMWLDMETLSRDEGSEFNAVRVTEYRAILCILLVYAITIKLSIGLLVILALIPGIDWIKERQHRKILSCIGGGLIIALPYFIRNYIISGWILYPSTLINLGSPDWQLPKGEAAYDAREIGMWGRGIMQADYWDKVTAFNWIPNWFGRLAILEKAWVLGSLLAIILVLAMLIYRLVLFSRKKNQLSDKIFLLMLIISLATIFWFCSAPLVRYGYAYLMIMPLLTLGYMLEELKKTSFAHAPGLANLIFLILAAGVLVLKGKGLVQDILRTYNQDFYIMQKDYIDGEAHSYEVDGLTIYVADDAGQIGYYKFPSTPDVNNNFALRGADVSEGFRHKN